MNPSRAKYLYWGFTFIDGCSIIHHNLEIYEIHSDPQKRQSNGIQCSGLC